MANESVLVEVLVWYQTSTKPLPEPLMTKFTIIHASLPQWVKQFLTAFLTDTMHINTLRPRQNGRHFADDTFSRIFVNENVRISIEFSLRFVPKGPINNIPALVQIMAWHRPGDKSLSEPRMVRLSTHLCVTRPQSVKTQIDVFIFVFQTEMKLITLPSDKHQY